MYVRYCEGIKGSGQKEIMLSWIVLVRPTVEVDVWKRATHVIGYMSSTESDTLNAVHGVTMTAIYVSMPAARDRVLKVGCTNLPVP